MAKKISLGDYVLKCLYIFYICYFKPITFCLYLQEIDSQLFTWNNPYSKLLKAPKLKSLKFYSGQFFWFSLVIPQIFYLFLSFLHYFFDYHYVSWFRCELFLLGWVLGHILSRVYRKFLGADLLYLFLFWFISFLFLFSFSLLSGDLFSLLLFFGHIFIGVLLGLCSGLFLGLVLVLFIGVLPILVFSFNGSIILPLIVSSFLGISLSIRFNFSFYHSILYGLCCLVIVNCLVFQLFEREMFYFFFVGSTIGFLRLPSWFLECLINFFIYIFLSVFKFKKVVKFISFFHDESIYLPSIFMRKNLYLAYSVDKDNAKKAITYLLKFTFIRGIVKSNVLLVLSKLMLDCKSIIDIVRFENDLKWFCDLLIQDRDYLSIYLSLIDFVKQVDEQQEKHNKVKVLKTALEYLEKKLDKLSTDTLVSEFKSELVIKSWKNVLDNSIKSYS